MMRGRRHHRYFLLPTFLLACVLAGCSGNGNQRDPYEGMNRAFWDFNRGLDRFVAQPLADLYVFLLPEPVRDGLHNAFDNLGYLNVIVNGFLQGKVDQGFQDCGRMLVNSTLGLAGVFDVATEMGMKRHDEDFGQTLAAWGMEQQPYLVLPLLGPTSGRDVWSVPVEIGTNPLFYFNFGAAVLVVGGFKAIDGRARVDEQLKQLEEAALDPYIFTREAFLAHREHLVHDGTPPADAEDDLYEDFDLEGMDDFDDEEESPDQDSGDVPPEPEPEPDVSPDPASLPV
jgi:phospholipid-binding lipoprotein MlaA